MKKRPDLSRLEGASQSILLVEDVARTAAFYRDIMRLPERDGQDGRYMEFDTGDGGVILIVHRGGSIAPLAQVAAEGSPATITFAVTPEGYDAWKRWVKKRGVEIEQETRWIHGGRSLYVLDPDGRRIEFKAPADPRAKAAADKAPEPPKTSEPVAKVPTRPPIPAESAPAAKAAEAKPVEPKPKPADVVKKEEPAKKESAAKVAAKKDTGDAPPINGVVETILYTDELLKAVAFYRDIIGLKLMTGTPGRFQAFDAGAGRVLLLFVRGSTLDPMTTPGGVIPPHDGQGPHHIAFAIATDDYQTWRTRLRAKGVVIESETHWERGGRSIYFRDPDKHLVELVTPGIWENY